MNNEQIKQLQELFSEAIACDVPMCDYTSFKIGGKADCVLFAKSEEQLVEAVKFCKENKVPYFVMGNGSNLLVSDRGMRQLVIMIRDGFEDVRVEGTRVIAGAGAKLSRVAEAAAEHSLTGLEFSFGIPGRLGGALTMNAGAYGGEMVQVVESVRILEADGTVHDVPAHDLAFGYRTSKIANGRIALSAVMQLQQGDEKEIRSKMMTYQQARKDKQPLQYPSAGSVFKRPVGYFAGALIEQANLKGTSVGGAQVSEKHAGFIINKGGATCQDVLDLIDLVQRRVYEQSGVRLETELRPIGDLG